MAQRRATIFAFFCAFDAPELRPLVMLLLAPLAAVGAVNDVVLTDRPREGRPARRRRHKIFRSKNGQARRGTAEHDGSLEVWHVRPRHAVGCHTRMGLLGLAAQQHVRRRLREARYVGRAGGYVKP